MTRLRFIASPPKTIPSSEDHIVLSRAQLGAYTPPGTVRRAIEWTQKIAETRYGGQRLLDALRYNGVSLWWFCHTLFFSTAKEAISTIEQTERVLREKAPSEVVVSGFGRAGELIARVCEKNGIQCTLTGSRRWSVAEGFSDTFKISAARFLLWLKEYRRRRLGGRSSENVGRASGSPRLVFLSPSVNWRSIWSYEREKSEKRDVFMGRVMEGALRLGYELICVDVDYSISGAVDVLRDKTTESELAWIPFERYINDDALQRFHGNPNLTSLRGIFHNLNENSEFRKILEYHSIQLYGYFVGRLRRLFSDIHLVNYARIIEGARELVRIEKPAAIAMTYETGAYAKALIVAGQEAGVPTLGIQHGFVSPESAEYMHTRTSLASSEDGCPIPTITAVGGEYTEELLTKASSYRKKSVVVTGYSRHDDLAELIKNQPKLRRDDVLRQVGLSEAKKTIMVASGGFHLRYGWAREYDREILNTLVDLVLARADVQLVVRLHPMEDGRMQRDLIDRRKTPAAVVKGEKNDLLWASEVFVTVNSSTAIDALILGKPVLMLDVADEDVPMVDLGSAALRCKLADLHEQVEALMSNPTAAERLRLAARTEVKRHANTVDGYASARIASLLQKLATSNEKN